LLLENDSETNLFLKYDTGGKKLSESPIRRLKLRQMSRTAILIALATLVAVPAMTLASPARAQIGGIFSNAPPRPPGAVPDGSSVQDPDEEDVPDLPPEGRVLPIPNRPQPGIAAPPVGSVQSQPLPPVPGGAATVPPNQPLQPGVATAPPQTNPGAQDGSVASAPAAPGVPGGNPAAGLPNPLPGLPPGQRQPRGAPPTPATLQPGDEIVTEPPEQKIVNKKAVFSGLDKITGRIINFDVDVGETVQFGALRVKPDACFTRPATEATNTDAFVEVDEITLQGEVKKIFSGWMFAASPGLHGVEHPIYDIWLTDCKAPDQAVATQVDTKPASVPAQKRQPSIRPPGVVPPPPVQQRPQPSGAFPPFR
jgi:hypothetical protein